MGEDRLAQQPVQQPVQHLALQQAAGLMECLTSLPLRNSC